MMNTFLPINIKIDHIRILLVGGGKVALHKLQTLLKFTKAITVVAPTIMQTIKECGVECREREYAAADLENHLLVYACTDKHALNRQIKADANLLGKLVNVADSPEHCDFISPALFITGEMTVAVSSQGRDVKKSILWRDKLKEFLENDKIDRL